MAGDTVDYIMGLIPLACGTLWKNFQVYEEKDHAFILLKYVVRACHMIPAFVSSQGKHYYLNDLIDSDMFLRCGN